ncbi:glycoside hydrolase family 57 protein [uncultured Desulfovibrio sp.]|uniref:glycoside hydrolase family 57 protein n=1 Tax=uncultured Desulfovibrio sp. TaxID=167968 RepID=UPI0028048DB0|nr:glycoside hydrolase family 57 protein [uncultured Desulfovibrio sp.]
MSAICFYFQVHQPYRLRHYTFFDIGANSWYEDENANCGILLKVARKCYLPMNALLLKLIRRHEGQFKVSFSISGTALDQFETYAPEVIQSYRELVATGCVELLSETYNHSLSFLYSPDEFREQVRLHDDRIEELFGVRPTSFRNTELIYNNALAHAVEEMGYKAILAEGADHVLGWRSPNFVYKPSGCESLRLLLKNYRLSDDIAFRFSNHDWPEFPLTAEKFASWAQAAGAAGDIINLFMDYETFGEHQWESTGIFQFMEALPDVLLSLPGFSFVTPTEAAAMFQPVASLDVHNFMSWADAERDLTAWLGNDMQQDAITAVYRLEEKVKASRNEDLLRTWRRLQTSDHFYYMCTKWFADGDVHSYFNPYGTPYDAYINYMNVLADFGLTLDAPLPAAGRPRS